MTGEIITAFGIVGITLALLLSEKVRADIVAVLTLLMLVLTRLVTPGEAVQGFGSPAIMTVCAILVLSAGLYRTGVATVGERDWRSRWSSR